MPQSMPADVAAAFAGFDDTPRAVLVKVRAAIFKAAAAHGAGPLTETLKWRQPAYLTQATRSGSTIRLGVQEGRAAVFFNCNTSLVDSFRADLPGAFTYSGNRALLLDAESDSAALAICLGRALTYHRNKRKVPA